MKIIKYLAFIVLVLVLLFAAWFTISYNSSEQKEIRAELSDTRTSAKDTRNAATMKIVALALFMYVDENGVFPSKLNALPNYSLYVNSESEYGFTYTSDGKKFKLCSPYSKTSTTFISDEYSEWSVKDGKLCLDGK